MCSLIFDFQCKLFSGNLRITKLQLFQVFSFSLCPCLLWKLWNFKIFQIASPNFKIFKLGKKSSNGYHFSLVWLSNYFQYCKNIKANRKNKSLFRNFFPSLIKFEKKTKLENFFIVPAVRKRIVLPKTRCR